MGVSKPGRWALKTRRWQALRLQAIDRDQGACCECGSRKRLEVHHVRPVRHAPELAFDLRNLRTLCASCHTRATRQELGIKEDPERAKWRAAVRSLMMR